MIYQQVWQMGYEAFQCGDDENDNPCEPDTSDSKAWRDGFKQAQDNEAKGDNEVAPKTKWS